jgi:hypothetical protein
MASKVNRPSPPPLPREQQREFDKLRLAASSPTSEEINAGLPLHPDAASPLVPQFEGDVNPTTGECGGPKREPVGRWGDDHGDWSFKGRVSDF